MYLFSNKPLGKSNCQWRNLLITNNSIFLFYITIITIAQMRVVWFTIYYSITSQLCSPFDRKFEFRLSNELLRNAFPYRNRSTQMAAAITPLHFLIWPELTACVGWKFHRLYWRPVWDFHIVEICFQPRDNINFARIRQPGVMYSSINFLAV